MAWVVGNRYLTTEEMVNNAYNIVLILGNNKGWSAEAVAAILGNMESESTINPGIWQSLDEGNMSGGFGLVQWTPATNFTEWADSNGYSWSDGEAQLIWIDEYTTTFGQWIPTESYPLSFDEFKVSTESPEYLASAFLKNFERAGVEVEAERQANARKWYTYITDGTLPGVPDTPEYPSFTKTKRKKFNFILFNRQRRTIV